MTKEELYKANQIKEEINKLEDFLSNAEKVWKGKIIKQNTKYIVKSIPYGIVDSEEYLMNTEIKDKVLDVLREYLKELYEKLNNI